MVTPAVIADLAPAIQSREAADPETYPAQPVRELFEAGVIGGPLPSSTGGSGWTPAEAVTAVEALARASGSVALIAAMPMGLSGVYAMPDAAIPPEHRNGWHEQVERYAAAVGHARLYAAANSERGAGGSLAATKTVASRDTGGVFRLTGDKILATGGANAAMFFSTARPNPAELPGCGVVEMFLVPGSTEGVEIKSDWNGFGTRSTESQSLHYEAAPATGFHRLSRFHRPRSAPPALVHPLCSGSAGLCRGDPGRARRHAAAVARPSPPALGGPHALRGSQGLPPPGRSRMAPRRRPGLRRPHPSRQDLRCSGDDEARGRTVRARRWFPVPQKRARRPGPRRLVRRHGPPPPLVLALDTMLDQFDLSGPLGPGTAAGPG
jgi:hypothetical protein